jgi:hypothetical protein
MGDGGRRFDFVQIGCDPEQGIAFGERPLGALGDSVLLRELLQELLDEGVGVHASSE